MNSEIFTIIGWIVCSTAGLAVALTFLVKIISLYTDWVGKELVKAYGMTKVVSSYSNRKYLKWVWAMPEGDKPESDEG